MAQFDVYQNPNKNTRTAFPYILDIQSPIICDLSTRIVIPLARSESFQKEQLLGLTPQLTYQGETLLLLTPQIASMPAKLLKKPVGSLSHFRDDIISALDFAITGV